MQHTIACNSGVVDQNLNRPVLLLDYFERLLTGGVIGDIEFDGFASGFGAEFLRRFLIAVISGDNVKSIGLE